MMVATLVSGMAFMLWWPVLVEHSRSWRTGADMWGIFRAAHYIGWGFVGGVYDPSTGVNSPPGLEVLLAPVAMLSGHLGLSESFPPFFVSRPTAALLLEPIELSLASTVLFAVDALAELLKVGKRRRIFLCIAVAVMMWPTVAVWGHAEDCLALALAIYSVIACLNGKWKACGWLFGFALVTQPLVVMTLPIVLAASPAGQRVMMAMRSIALTMVLVGIAFASDALDAYRALVQQPTPPLTNHATPWASLAPRLSEVVPDYVDRAMLTYHSGKVVERTAHVEFHTVALVSGGAGRAIELVLALLLGLYVWRRPQPSDRLIWLVAVSLGMRCMFEAVMLPYYLGPPLILALAIASLQGARRFVTACAIAFGLTVFAYCVHLGPWAWWLPVSSGMAAVLALGYPNNTKSGLDQSPGAVPPDFTEPCISSLVDVSGRSLEFAR
jgi:hypothetical protein